MRIKNQKSIYLAIGLLTVALTFPAMVNGQNTTKVKKAAAKVKGPEDFPELVFANIPGAPKLSKPKLITGRLAPVQGGGNGWAAPAVYDWDGDGKKDLLIGEFASGKEYGSVGSGNFIKVYLNEGTEKYPAFSGGYRYAEGKYENGNGTPLSVYTWCCISFTPRFIDLDNDGYQDLLTGQYNPGDVTWFRGSEEGFLPGEKLKQAGDPSISYGSNQKNATNSITDTTGIWYWMYSSADFGDFDGDGDADMIVGGGALRMSENIGTKTSPKFGVRKLLLDIYDKPLSISKITSDIVPAGNGGTIPYVVDWDNDGVLDLLVTSDYSSAGSSAVTYFRGLKTAKGLRFEPGVSLFSAKNGMKTFPGDHLNICVTDWNNDGVNDLVIGSRVPTIKNKFDPTLSWGWEEQTRILKLGSPAYRSILTQEFFKKQLDNAAAFQKKKGWSDEEAKKKMPGMTKGELYKQYYGKPEYKDLAIQGYVYVMLGSK